VNFVAVGSLFDCPTSSGSATCPWVTSGPTPTTVAPDAPVTGPPTSVPTLPAIPRTEAPDPNNPILATIRQVESGDSYTSNPPGNIRSGGASGAYQMLDSVWAGYGGFARAYQAPPYMQDIKAAQLVTTVLTPTQGVECVPVSWYIGKCPPDGSPQWDQIPAAWAGNNMTPRGYQAKWMDVYQQKYQAYVAAGGGPH
jgi:hypothetical protein